MNAHHAVPALERPFLDGTEIGMTGGIEGRINTAEGLHGRGHRIAHALFAGHIAGQADRARQLSSHRPCPVAVDVEQDHSSAILGIAAGDRRGQSRTCARGQ